MILPPARIILFDVDGVLITPGGYRKALNDTIASFLQQLGQPQLQPDESVFEHFEALGITSEWDMVPLFLCMCLQALCETQQLQPDWGSLEDAIYALRGAAPITRPDFHAMQDAIGRITGGRAGVPSASIYTARGEDGFPFPRLRHAGLLAQLLTTTRDMDASPSMYLFQQHILGSELFEQRYARKASLRRENYLRTYDSIALNEQSRDLLTRRIENRDWLVSIYTARPSMPPAGVDADHNAAFSPEAEQALALVGIAGIGNCAYGKLVWLAEQVPLNGEQLLKPSPVHALAAIASFYAPEDPQAYLWAARVYQEHLAQQPLSLPDFALPQQITLQVFEDSPGGLKGANAAREILTALGIAVDLRLWGITASEQKKQALLAQGARVIPDINQAIALALG